jgi:XRE family transcriptional regulator, regulator of sulfur utilization
MNIGFAIKSIRKQLGVSQYELSNKTGVSQASLSQFENGIKNPSTKTINKICEALDIPASLIYILGIDNTDVPESKKFMFDSLYPSIRNLALDIILPENQKVS